MRKTKIRKYKTHSFDERKLLTLLVRKQFLKNRALSISEINLSFSHSKTDTGRIKKFEIRNLLMKWKHEGLIQVSRGKVVAITSPLLLIRLPENFIEELADLSWEIWSKESPHGLKKKIGV